MLLNQKNRYQLSRTNQGLFLLLIHNDFVSNEIAKNGCWEPAVTNFVLKNIHPGDTVVEIGANIGYYTTLLGKCVGSTGRVYAFEASDEAFSLANLSVKINNLSERVKLEQACITDVEGKEVNFSHLISNSNVCFRTNIGENGILLPEEASRQDSIKLYTSTLDAKLSNVKADWIRMDIEGAEILALHGAKNLIKNSPSLKIIMEWNLPLLKRLSNVRQFIYEMHLQGFHFFSILDDGDLGPELSEKELINNSYYDIVLRRK